MVNDEAPGKRTSKNRLYLFTALVPSTAATGSLIFKRKSLSGSLIGGTKETQEMLDYCAKNNIVSDIEIIPINKINEAYDRMLKSDVKYRFVIDMKTL